MFEKLLSLIERGVAALEVLAASPPVVANAAAEAPKKPAAKAAPKAKAPEPGPEADPFADPPEALAAPEKEYTRQEVRDALVAYSERPGQSQQSAVELVKKVGKVEKFSDLPKEKFAAVVKAATA